MRRSWSAAQVLVCVTAGTEQGAGSEGDEHIQNWPEVERWMGLDQEGTADV